MIRLLLLQLVMATQTSAAADAGQSHLSARPD